MLHKKGAKFSSNGGWGQGSPLPDEQQKVSFFHNTIKLEINKEVKKTIEIKKGKREREKSKMKKTKVKH